MVVPELAQNVRLEREMASNPASPFGIEFRHVEDLHPSASRASRDGGSASVAGAKQGTRRASPPRSAFSAVGLREVGASSEREAPFAALAARHGRPLRIAILSDFTRISYANGAAFQTRFLYQELRRCGHEVTLIGPRDPDALPEELPPGTVALPSLPLKMYPGLHMPFPSEAWVYDPSRWNFDLVFAQTTTSVMHFARWLRRMKGIPVLFVNTTHLSAAYDVLLPEKLAKLGWVHAGLELALKRPYENHFAEVYNDSDGLVVLSEGLRSYWRERGVTAPIHVIPRAVQPQIFDKPLGPDPYTHLEGASDAVWRGPRLLCAGRHTREKSQDRIIRIFARLIATKEPDATLTMLGEGPDSAYYKRVAREEGVEDRVFFPGEVPFTQMADYYAYADLFVHASLSETYGNVMGEALWCGTPTVAFADGMGVSAQIKDGVNGVLLSPGKSAHGDEEADQAFARAVIALLANPQERARLGKAASRMARERCSPEAVQQRISDAFRHAQEHAAACGIRPAVEGPKVLQWMTTLRHFRSWAAIHGSLYVIGHIRPPHEVTKGKASLHPQMGS